MKASSFVAAIPWILLTAWAAYAEIAPTSFWIDYADLTIGDGVVNGPSPSLALAAADGGPVVYQKPMVLHWYRTLFKQDGADWIPTDCYTEGEGSRYPGYVSVSATLEAFMGSRACAKKLPAGEYYVEDIIRWESIVSREDVIQSNDFRITEEIPRASAKLAPLRPDAPSPPTHEVRRAHARPAQGLPWLLNLIFHRR